MYTKKILNMISDENLLLQSREELDKYISQYPQVSIFQSLRAKLFQLNNDPGYQIQLKKSAVFAPDRKKLYHFIIQPEIAKKIKKVELELESERALINESPLNSETEQETTKNQIIAVKEEIEETVEYKKTPSPLEKYSNKKIVVPSKDELARKQLEREIMQHAISSSIILDAESLILEEPESTSEENIESNKVEISKDDFEKFGLLDWLKANEEGKLEKKTRQKNTKELISSFIRKVPEKITSAPEKQTLIEINRPKHEFFSPENMAKLSLMENEDLVTETLANIYAKQGNLAKARKAYDKLSLKFPEKSNYFARLKKELNIKQ